MIKIPENRRVDYDLSDPHGNILLNQTKGQLMNDITFSCNGVIFTGASCDQSITVSYAEAGFFEYEDDYVCPNCLNEEEMHLIEWYDNGIDDSYALASAGYGTDEDYM